MPLTTTALVQFDLEDRRRRGMLLASVSESVSRSQQFTLPLPPQLRKAISRLPQPLKQPLRQRPGEAGSSGGKPPGQHLGRAGAELQRAVTVFAGVLVTAVAKTAQQLAAHHHRGPGRRQQFHESFRLPWQFDRRAGTRRATREALALARTLVDRGLDYERNLDVRAAVQCFEEVNRLVPDEAPYLAMLAKQWSDLTFYYDVTTDRERQLVNLKALEYADKAVADHPNNVLGHVAQCVSKGRLALFTDNRTKVRLAKEAQEAARVAITVDPQSDIAHHLMGRWHHEMAQINPILRTLVRLMYGTALSPGSHTEALASFERAVELNPGRLIHRVERGKVLLALGRKEEAARQFEEALTLAVEDVNAWHTRMDGERLLAQLQRRPYSQPSLVPPHAQQQHAGGSPAGTPASLSTAALLESSQSGAPPGTAAVATA